MRVEVANTLSAVPRADWNALWRATPGANPFSRHEWLAALEDSGCVGGDTSWAPQHFALYDGAALLAVMPGYVKLDSDGDFSRDWGWAEAAQRARLRYYPKLVFTVPFTPVTGARLLTAPGVDRRAAASALMSAARKLCEAEKLSGAHVLFPTGDECVLFEAAGMGRRVAFQYHFVNPGYGTPDELLARFDSKRRNTARRERGAPAKQGITLRTVRGEEMRADPTRWAKLAHKLHRSTVDKLMWGRRWLDEAFYVQAFVGMPEHMELVLAEREGAVIAGAFNVSSDTHLFGRYWGCFEEHPFLHFNVCLYHSIDDMIARGLRVFEGGAGGEHKIPRGFEPAETYSNHLFVDPRLDVPLRRHIEEEAGAREAALAEYRARSPIFRRPREIP